LERSLAGEEVIGEKLGRGVVEKELGRGVVGEKLLCEEEVAEEVAGEELVMLMLMCVRERGG
jgi:hypothetical protein